MSTKTLLRALFGCILLSLVICTGWAGMRQSVFEWGGLTTGPDRYRTIATLTDAYFGFTTFYVWAFSKQRGWLARLRPDQPAADILLARYPQSSRP